MALSVEIGYAVGIDLQGVTGMSEREIYERALAEMRQCEQRLRRLRLFIETYEELSASNAASTASAPSPEATTSAPPTLAEDQTIPSASEELEELTDAALREAGRPLRRAELYPALLARGYSPIDSKDPLDVLTTRLYRLRHRFTNSKERGYWFANEPVPDDEDDDRQSSLVNESDSQPAPRTRPVLLGARPAVRP